MANIALLVPNDELFGLTHDVLQEQQKRLRGACQFVSMSLLHFTFLSLRQGQQP